jgi:hypothetical protein
VDDSTIRHDDHSGHRGRAAPFKTFDFLNASGNLMGLFTDGRDDQASLNGRRLDEIMATREKFRVPL